MALTGLSMNKLFYMLSHYSASETLGDKTTTINVALEKQYIPMGIKIFNSITDLDLVADALATVDAMTFGDAYPTENQIVAYIAAYLAEVDLHPKELSAGESAIWSSRFMQQALQLIQTQYPDKIEAKLVGGKGLVWIISPNKTHNISLIIGMMRSNNREKVSFGAEPGWDEPTTTDELYAGS
jgi:hypothetical protein